MRLTRGSAVAALAAVLAGCAGGPSGVPGAASTASATTLATTDDKGAIVLESTAEYPIYDSQRSLSQAASVVVVARVVRLGEPTSLGSAQVALPANKRDLPGPITTDVNLSVEQVLRGTTVLRDATVTVLQIGGSIGRYTSRVAGDPLARLQDRYVLFLVPAPAGTGVSHVIVGGPQGRYVVADDSTLQLVEGTSADGTGAQREIAGTTVDELAKAITATF